MKIVKNLNSLPRPTFRWVKVNDIAENEILTKTSASTFNFVGDIEIIKEFKQNISHPLSAYEGIQKELLNRACSNGMFEVSTNDTAKKQVYIEIPLVGEENIKQLHLRVLAKENTDIEIIYVLTSEDVDCGEVHLFTEIKAEKNAKVTVKKVQLLDETVKQYEHRWADIAENADVQYINIELGGSKNVYNFLTELNGRKSNLNHEFAYFGINEQKFDVSMQMLHQGIQSTSDIQHVGALNHLAKKTFRGTIDFLRGCMGSEGNEEDTALLLNDKVKSISLPLLLCKEDNVSGNHAASAGQIDNDKLYYLMSRGFNEEEAKFILVESMLRPVIAQIGDDILEKKALEFLDTRI